MSRYCKLIATGSDLPPTRVTNHDLVARLAAQGIETSDEWIVSRSGIQARHYVAPGMTCSDMATQAARRALDAAGLRADSIDLIIVATSTPDNLGSFPSTASIVQRKLGVGNHCAAFDVQAVCTGFIYALSTADVLIRSGGYRRALVIGAEVFSRVLDFNDRATCVLFGDGAGAVVLAASGSPGVLACELHADGRHADILCIPGRLDQGAIKGRAFLYMNGQAVFKLALTVLEQVAQSLLRKQGMHTRDIDWLVPHQANIRIISGTARKLGLGMDKVVITLDQHGNTSAASIPLALDQAWRDGRIRSGQHLMLEAVGGGLTWGGCLLKW